MAKLPETILTDISAVTSLIDAHHAAKPDRPRPHLGASMLGHHCDRWLWLSFRWASREEFEGRILRLFRRGHSEEATIIADLRAVGVDVRGTQARVDFGAHVSGSIDGVAESGIPEAPKTPHLLEFKTHALKSFNDLTAKGVRASKPMHYTQMQVYMHGMKLTRALYVAVCKDDDRIHAERVRYDKEHAERAIARGRAITLAERMPPPISTDPTWYQCRFCPAHAMCHKSQPTKEVNCRTCAHATPLEDSTWHCARWSDAIPTEAQYAGCDDHVFHPDLVPWQMEGSEDGLSVTWLIGQSRLRNGVGGLKSGALLDPTVQAIAEAFDAS
jgi:hypothetical protein